MKTRRSLTMKDLVSAVQDIAKSDAEVVAVMAHMFKTGRVSLMGRRAGSRLAAAAAK